MYFYDEINHGTFQLALKTLKGFSENCFGIFFNNQVIMGKFLQRVHTRMVFTILVFRHL